MALERWQTFFQEVVSLVTAGERHYGVCNANYSDYMIERFKLSIQSCESTISIYSKWSIRCVIHCYRV